MLYTIRGEATSFTSGKKDLVLSLSLFLLLEIGTLDIMDQRRMKQSQNTEFKILRKCTHVCQHLLIISAMVGSRLSGMSR